MPHDEGGDLRIVLHAAEYTTGGQLLLTFAGGSKTMSADMQFAAAVFGCDAMIHAVDKVMFPMNPKDPAWLDIEQFTASLPADFQQPLCLW